MSILVNANALCEKAKQKAKQLMSLLKILKKLKKLKIMLMYIHVSDTCIMIWPVITLVFALVHYHACIIAKLHHNPTQFCYL